jgi:hypothetical protein
MSLLMGLYPDPQSGFVFMGGIKGSIIFSPQQIKESAVVPDLLIDKISGQKRPFPIIRDW